MKQFDARAAAGLLTVPVLLALFAMAGMKGEMSASNLADAPLEMAVQTINTDAMGDVSSNNLGDGIAAGGDLATEYVAEAAADEGEATETEAAPEEAVDASEAGDVAETEAPAESEKDAIKLATALAPKESDLGYDESLVTVDGTVVKLLGDVEVTGVTGKYDYAGAATLDLASHELNMGKAYLNLVANGGELTTRLTIADSLGGGKVVSSNSEVRVLQASSGATLVIDGDLTVEGKKTATIVLSGGTIEMVNGTILNSGTGNGIQAQSSSMVKVKGGTIKAAGAAIKALSGSKVLISDGTVSGGTDGIYISDTTENRNLGSITITGGTVTSDGYGITLFDATSLTMSAGEIAAVMAITTNGSGTNGAKLDISGGKVTGKTVETDDGSIVGVAMYLAGNAAVKIDNAEISGYAGLVVRGGSVEIGDGAKITATGTDSFSVGDAKVDGVNTLVPVSAVVVDDIEGYQYRPTLEINGGTFDGQIAYTNSKVSGDEVLTEASDKIKVHGGKFSASLLGTDYLKDGLKVQAQGSDGYFTYYTTIDDAPLGAIVTDGTGTGKLREIEFFDSKGNKLDGFRWNHDQLELPTREEVTVEPPKVELEFVGWVMDPPVLRNSQPETEESETDSEDEPETVQVLILGRGGGEGTEDAAEDEEAENYKDAMVYPGEVVTLPDDEDVNLTIVWVDKTKIRETIESTDEYDVDLYTTESWNAMQGALGLAKTVAGDEKAIQYEVNQANKDLVAAIAGLEKKPVEAPETPDSGMLSSQADDGAAVRSLVTCMVTGSLVGLAAVMLKRRKAAKHTK